MKKYGSIIMLVVVAALAVIFFATREKPVEKVEAPYSVPAVKNLARVELTTPGDDGGLVVLERGSEGWRLTKPVEAPAADKIGTTLDEELDGKINTDDIQLSDEKASEYGLGEDAAIQVALYPDGATSPAAEFDLGKTISVPGTRAKRTYIRGSDGKVYRAHTSLGETLGRGVSHLRSKTIQKLEMPEVHEIQVSYQDGSTVKLVREGQDWKLREPAVDFELEKSQINALVRNVSNLQAREFVDDKQPADVGLQPAYATIVTRAGDERHILKISKMDPESETFYVKPDKSPHIFVIAETTGKALTPTPLSLRNRLVREMDPETVTRVEFGGDDRIVVQKKEDGWSFARGARGTVKKSALDSRIKALAKLRAIRFDEVSPAEAGLEPPAEKVTFHTTDGKHTLLFGDVAPGGEDGRGNIYAKWDDQDLVMIISEWVKNRSTPKPSDLTADES